MATHLPPKDDNVPLCDIGVAFANLKTNAALRAARCGSPSVLDLVRGLSTESLKTEQRKTIAEALYRLAKTLIQQQLMCVAITHLNEARRWAPADRLYVERLALLKSATENKQAVRWQTSMVEMQHALGAVCAKSHCTCESHFDVAQCRGVVGAGLYHQLGNVSVFTMGAYYSRWMGDRWTRLLKAVKKQQRYDLLPHMANVVADALLRSTRFVLEADIVVPVPPSPEKYAVRGFAPNDIVAKQLSVRLALPYRPVLTRAAGIATRDASDAELEAQFTVTNVAELKRVSVLLVEDIWTWGRTIPICAAKAMAAGASSVLAVALGNTQG